MKYFNEQLQALQEKTAQKKHLDTVLKSLYDQQRDLQDKVRELNQIRISENADVEKLEGFSLATLYYVVTGKKDEMLDKEKQEAYAAQVRYDTAQRLVSDLQLKLRKYRT